MSGPSDKAVEAVAFLLPRVENERRRRWPMSAVDAAKEAARKHLDAAHDPALGLDRSVCLRDVVESVRMLRGTAFSADDIADLIEREFA